MFGSKKRLVMCQACRGLIAASVRTCPLCGRDSVPAAPARTVAHAGSPRFFTLLLITINVALFILMTAVDSNSGRENSFLNGAGGPVLLDFGSRSVALIARGQWWRLVTPIFIHLGVIHLLFNNIALFQIGPLVEESLGSQKFIFVYLACGIVGNIGSFVFGINGAGASGAIFGLIALAAVYGYRMGGIVGRSLMKQMAMWAGIGLVMGQAIHADNVNHIGGLITGAALGFALSLEHPATSRLAFAWNTAAIASIALVAGSFAMVALQYGKLPNPDNVSKLDARVETMRVAFNNSLVLKNGSAQDFPKIAGALRSAADDIRSLPQIDAPSDAIRERLVDVLTRRASLFDGADKDFNSLLNSQEQDHNEAQEAYNDYIKWRTGVGTIYGR
jgi:rhomboid protease GluP